MPPGRAGCGRGRSLAWCCLSFGIALGSYWAYYELGWGGWWFWDPVENASFMPWLAATALLHSAIVVEKRDALKSWTILLAILAFSLSLLGTFLVRSGVLTSVHAFAVDPARGMFVLALLGIAVGGSLALYAWRAPQLQGRGVFAPDLARGRPAAQQPAARHRVRDGAARHALPAAAGDRRRRQDLGRTALFQRHLRAVDGAAADRDADRRDARLEAGRSRRRARPAQGRARDHRRGPARAADPDAGQRRARRPGARARGLGDRRLPGRAGQPPAADAGAAVPQLAARAGPAALRLRA